MAKLMRGRALPAAALAVLAAAAIALAGRGGPAGLPGPEELPDMGWEAAEAALLGLPRQDVLDAWGEPDGMLSGFFGDIYALEEGGRVIVYYDTEPMNRGEADSRTVPVQYISCPVTEIPPLEDTGWSFSLPVILEGHTREEVHAAWGEPHKEAANEEPGCFCDVYWTDESQSIAVYYDIGSVDAGAADARTVPVQYVSLGEA